MAKEGRQRGRSPQSEVAKRSTLKISNVRRTPNCGMKMNTGRNEPRILPAVEMAYSEPLIRPLAPILFVAKRMANGETRPSKVKGIAKSNNVPSNELKKVLTDTCAIAVIDNERIGWHTNGISAMASAAIAVNVHNSCGEGCRSASRPPRK